MASVATPIPLLGIHHTDVLIGCHGNGLGCLAMMYSIFESLAYNVRGEDDLLNPIGAGVLSGAIYKSTAGVRMAGTAGISFGIFALAGAAASKELAKRGNTRLGKLF